MKGWFTSQCANTCMWRLLMSSVLSVPASLDLGAQILADPVTHKVVFLEEQDLCERGNWRLVFGDEFNGNELDLDQWVTFFPFCWDQDQCEVSRTGYPDAIQIYRDENVALSGDGILRLTAKQGALGHWYSVSSVITSGAIFNRYKYGRGRYECRCKVPKSTSKYLWPAFWMYGGGPRCSEIDVMEILWAPSDQYHHSLHRTNYECNENHKSDEMTHDWFDLSADFHVFSVDWDTWFVNFYIDEHLTYRACRLYDLLNRPVSQCVVPTGVYIQNQGFPAQDAQVSIIADLAVHAGRPGAHMGVGPPIPDLPATMEIDYIRVYQRE